ASPAPFPFVAWLPYNPRVTVEDRRRFVHVITHGPHCLDGVAAAVAVARYHARDHVTPYFCNPHEIHTRLAKLRCDPPAASHEVWITDIAWTDDAVDRHLRTLIDRGVKVHLIDHHRTTLERFNAGHLRIPLATCILSEAHAASRLVYDHLHQRQ